MISQWLEKRKGRKVHIRIPKKGTKEKLVELAQRNAELVLSQDKERIKREEGRTIGAVKEIALKLGLPGMERIEAYDISNISGFQSVDPRSYMRKESQNAVITANSASNPFRDQMTMQVWRKSLPAVLSTAWMSRKPGERRIWTRNLAVLHAFRI